MPLPFLTPSTLNVAVRADAIPGVVMNNDSAPVQSANVAALNTFFDSLKNPYSVTRTLCVVPAGRLHIDDWLIIPPKTNIKVMGVGSGLNYRVGLFNFTYPGQGGSESTIISCAQDPDVGIFRGSFSGLEVSNLKLQGRRIPTNDSSGVEEKAGYGILVEGNDFPATGKCHFHNLTFVDLGYPFYYPSVPEGQHGDTISYGKMIVHGCDGIAKFENPLSIGHYFTDLIEFAGDGVSAGQIGFDIIQGGDIHAPYVHWNCQGGTVAKFHGGSPAGSFSQNSNDFSFGVRLDTPNTMTDFCLVDLTDTTNNDWPFHIRLKGSMGGAIAGTHYVADDLIKLAAGQVWQQQDIAQDVQVWYGAAGSNAAARNAQRALHATFNSFRSPTRPYHEDEPEG